MTHGIHRYLAVLAGLFCVLQAAEKPLSVDTYCELSKRLYALSELEWKERVAAAEQIPNDKPQLIERLGRVSAQYQGHRAKLFAAFETSSSVFGKFGSQNRDAVEQYLESQPSVKAGIRDLRDRVQALIDRFESLMAAAQKGGAK
jgi:hypothetical protein